MTNPKHAKSVFLDALERTDARSREEFVAEACGDDLDLRREVDALFGQRKYCERVAMSAKIEIQARVGF